MITVSVSKEYLGSGLKMYVESGAKSMYVMVARPRVLSFVFKWDVVGH